ncbi:hypothetical protein pipiens_007892, partial [Culex pipiens pipiens]
MQLLNSKRNQSVPTPAPPQVTVPVTEAAIPQREKVPAEGAAVTPATSGSSVAGSSKTPAEILKVLQSIAKETEEPMDTSLEK